MTELILELDRQASQSINDLMKHYRSINAAELISKSLSLLKVAAHLDQTQGELFARKGSHETKIIVN